VTCGRTPTPPVPARSAARWPPMTWRCCGSHRAAASQRIRPRQPEPAQILEQAQKRGLGAVQRVEQIEKGSGTRSDPPRRWSPAGRGIPVRGRRPAGRRIPAGGWVAVVPAGTPLWVIPVTRMRWPVAAVGSPVGRITGRWRRGYGRRRDSRDRECGHKRNSRSCHRECT
jgi:hypothetical protein